jgi:quinolinate synthase
MSQEYTDKLLEMVEEGLLDKDTVIMACVKFMGEKAVKTMTKANEFLLNDEGVDFDEEED